MKRTINRWATSLHNCLATAQRLSLATLCGLLLVSSSLAQEQQRLEPWPTPEEPTAKAAPTPQPPDPNEMMMPGPQANQSMDGDINLNISKSLPYVPNDRRGDKANTGSCNSSMYPTPGCSRLASLRSVSG